MSGIDKLKHLKLFAQVHRSGSFAAAAQELGIAPSTISKSIQRLEKEIGLTLIERTTRAIAFTDAGHDYANTATSVLAQLNTTEQRLKENQLQAAGTLNINVPISYGRLYILPFIPKFKAQHPNINVNLTFSDHYVDLIKDGYDLSIRTGKLDDSNFIARKLSPVDFVTCATETYIQQNNAAINSENWDALNWIKFRYKQSGKTLAVLNPSDPHQPLETPHHTLVDDGEAMMSLCENHVGLAQVPHFIARKWLSEKRAVTLGQAFRSEREGVYAIYPSRNPANRTQLFIAFLQQQLAEWNETPEQTWALSNASIAS